MVSQFRSELMSFYQIIFQSEFTYNFIAKLGDLGCVKFREKESVISTLNVTHRKFIGELLFCTEIETRLNDIQDVIKQEKIPLLNIIDGVKIEVPSMKELNEIDSITKKVQVEINEVI